MGAFTDVTLVVSEPATAGGDGMHWAMGTAVGPEEYDTGGSAIDLSDVFKTKVQFIVANVDNADYRCLFVPGSSYDSATCELFVDDNAGTQITNTTDLRTPLAAVEWQAWGID